MSKCKAPGCTKYSSYGMPGQVARDFCKTHKTDEMICNRTRSKPQCKEEGCSTCPSYGLPGGRKEYCSVHKLDIMVYLCKVIIPICEAEDCDVVASFNYVTEKKRRYCVCVIVFITSKNRQKTKCAMSQAAEVDNTTFFAFVYKT